MTWDEFKERSKKAAKIALIIHYEMLKKLARALVRRSWTLIVCDESQRIKERSSTASRKMRQLRHSAEYKLALTGTPFDKEPQEMWAQFRFIRPEIFGDVWADFEDEYLRTTGFMGYKRTFRKNRLPRFLRKIRKWTIIIEAHEVGIKPPSIVRCPVDLEGKQARLYDEMEEELVVEVGGIEVLADLKITQITKCHQIAGGFLLDEDHHAHLVGKAKWQKVRSLLKRNKPPGVIFCKYKHEILWLHKRLVKKYNRVEVLWGKVKDKKRDPARTRLLMDFQAGKVDILICQVRTGGVGVDLWRGNFAIVYSTTHSSIDFEQLMARLSHIKRTVPPRFFLVFANRTVDEDIYLGLRNKKDVKRQVRRGIRQRRQKV